MSINKHRSATPARSNIPASVTQYKVEGTTMSGAAATLYGFPTWITDALHFAWNNPEKDGSVNFRALDALIRDILAEAMSGNLHPTKALIAIDAATAAYTRRGSVWTANPLA